MMRSRVHVLAKTEKSIIFLEVFPRNFLVPIHQHNNRESFHISKGCAHIFNDGHLLKVSKGMKIDVSPGVSHGLFTKEEPLECFVVIEGNDAEEITQLYWDFMKSH